MSTTLAPYHALVWLRDDLRTDDHPALTEAIRLARQHNGRVTAVYILDKALWSRPLGGASRWWLHHSLAALADDLQRLGVPLILRQGDLRQQLPDVVRQGHVQAVLCNRGQTPFLRRCEAAVREALEPLGCSLLAGGGELMVEPDKILTGSGQPYRVFTPFWKALSQHHQPKAPLPEPEALGACVAPVISGVTLASLDLLPTAPDWAGGLRESWQPGQAGAQRCLDAFLQGSVARYGSQRDFPAQPATSRLSPHLRFGELSPRRVWDVVTTLHGADGMPFLREVGWREFNHHLLFQWPEMATVPLKPEFARFPWRDDRREFQRWCQGQTGFPIVDAGQRELWQTGWMHNRVRMIVASFLVKDLLLPWQWGEEWMWDTLVDACPANNPGNWQWVSGCGADAAPYFRVFNPSLQAAKFDSDGLYQRRWVPESAAPGDDLFAAASTRRRYPLPMLDHGAARDRALAALASLKPDPDTV